MKRTPIKRKPVKQISYKNFWRYVTDDGRAPCAMADPMCDGSRDAHHYFPKRRIDLQLGGKFKPASIAAKQDVRNGVCLCRYHHDTVERGAICPEPREYHFFLIEHKLIEPISGSGARLCARGNKFSRAP